MKNQYHPLKAISPLDGRYHEKTVELSPYTSEEALIRYRVLAECVYFKLLSEEKVIRHLTAKEIKLLAAINSKMSFKNVLRVKEIEQTTNHDVKSVEVWLIEYFSKTSLSDITDYFHFCLTSEDINNVAYRLQFQNAKNDIIVPIIDQIIDFLMKLAKDYEKMPMLGRTHGQAAIPTTVGKEFANFAIRLNRENRKFAKFQLTGKMNGAIGCYDAHQLMAPEVNWINVSKLYAARLGLKSNLFTTQINTPEDILECFQILQRINGILLDLCQDMWRYISDDWFKLKKKEGEVGSSTMVQKVNPIDFENGEANAQKANSDISGFVNKLSVSRLQRDLSDSSTLRNIGEILGHSLLAYKGVLKGLGKISPNEVAINAALTNNWGILSEAVQLMLKRYSISKVEDPYTLVKTFFRGQRIEEEDYQKYVETLPLETNAKEKLKYLTPYNYLGLVDNLIYWIEEEIKESRL